MLKNLLTESLNNSGVIRVYFALSLRNISLINKDLHAARVDTGHLDLLLHLIFAEPPSPGIGSLIHDHHLLVSFGHLLEIYLPLMYFLLQSLRLV